MSDNGKVRIAKSVFGRYIIVKDDDPSMAWSGSHWDFVDQGTLPAGQLQLATFDTPEQAAENARSFGFTVIS